jgi:hypothetical protein
MITPVLSYFAVTESVPSARLHPAAASYADFDGDERPE